MKADFTRDSFERQKSFSRVMMQQGRVQLDSDWNEQTSLTLDYVRTLARDLLGRGAGPEGDCGFRIATKADLKAATPDPFTLEERAELNDNTNANALKNGDLLLFPGRYYVGGLAVELPDFILYSKQTGYPFGDDADLEALNNSAKWIAYLDVWEDFVSADQDPSIGDPALGGIDTCGRALIRWQVRVLPDKSEDDFNTLAALEGGRLSARTKPGEAPDSPCIIPPDARYRGIENQLYRVEIHQGSDEAGEGATFKWSRDNGSLTYPVNRIGDRIWVDRLGRDKGSDLVPGTWVELVDDFWMGHNPQGPLAQITDVSADDRSVGLEWAEPPPNLPPASALKNGLQPVLRRWDHDGQKEYGGAIPIEGGGELELEDGLFVKFEQGDCYRPGDYWLIPARVATSDILWPASPDYPQRRRPHGPAHHYAPLAKLDKQFKDLRMKFKPISVAI